MRADLSAEIFHYYQKFVKLMVDDEDEIERDKLSREACERYAETQDESEFVTWQKNHKFLHVQACAENLKTLGELKKEFLGWTKCPWGSNFKSFTQYLLTHKEGPSGMNNEKWALDMMTLFYNEPINSSIDFRDRYTISTMASKHHKTDESKQKMLADIQESDSDSSDEDESEPEAEPEPEPESEPDVEPDAGAGGGA